MPRPPTHYDVLQVRPDATREEIHRAYLERARDRHPDRQQPADAGPTDVDMAAVNEAWRVLGHPGRRRTYDATLRGEDPYNVPFSPRPSTNGAHAHDDDDDADFVPVSGKPSIIYGMPLIALILVLFGIFVFTAFALGGNDGEPDAGESRLGDCVVQIGEGIVSTVACSGPNEGQVVAEVDRELLCPEDTKALPLRDKVLCLATTG